MASKDENKIIQACKDLKLLTGLEFTSTEVITSSGEPLKVLQVLTPATYVPEYDLITLKGDWKPVRIKDSCDLAFDMARILATNLEYECGMKGLITSKNSRVHEVEQPDFLNIKKGSYKGALEFSLETKGRYEAFDMDALRDVAKKIEQQNLKARFGIGKKYQPATLSDRLVKETTEEDVAKIKEKKQQWAESMLDLRKEPNILLLHDAKTKLALDGLEHAKLSDQQVDKNKGHGGLN